MKVNVPESLNEIKLKDYQKYLAIASKHPDNIDLLNLKLVEIFCGIKIPDFESILKLSEFEIILSDIQKVFNKTPRFQQRFTHKGVEYGFIPDLEEITLKEYTNVNLYITNISEYHRAMAVMYRPIVKTKKDMYLIEDYQHTDVYGDVMKDVPLGIALGAQVFFYDLSKELLKDSLLSLNHQTRKNPKLTKKLETILDEKGGIQSFTQLLKDSYGCLIPSMN